MDALSWSDVYLRLDLRHALPQILVGLLMAEAIARLAVSQPLVWQRFENTGDTGHRIWRIQALRHHRPGETDFSPAYPVAFHETYGWTSRPGRFDQQGTITTVDDRGLRVPILASPPPDTPKMAFFGDSFGFGAEVSDDATYVAQLATMAPGLDLRNLSVIGFGHDQMLLRLRDEGPLHQPDIAVLMMVSCDIPRNLQRFTAWAKPVLKPHDGVWHAEPATMPPPAAVLKSYDRSSRLLDLLRVAMEPTPDAAHRRASETQTAQLLAAFAAEARAQGAEPWFVHAPILHEVTQDPTHPRWEAFAGRKLMSEVCEATKSVCLDLFDTFAEAHQQGKTLQTGTHWSREAHGLIAAALADTWQARKDALPIAE